MKHIKWFEDLGSGDVPVVGGKNASLGEMIAELGQLGVAVPDGFATTAQAYRDFLRHNQLDTRIEELLAGVTSDDIALLNERSRKVRSLIYAGEYPAGVEREIAEAYEQLGRRSSMDEPYVAVRSSATAEDLPNASFAGQQESFLMIHGLAELLDAVKRAMASLYTARAVSYRNDMGFEHSQVALSVGVQRMVRSDRASSGVIFTLDPDTGHHEMVYVTGGWGLGDNIVQGRIITDSWLVHKVMLSEGHRPIVWKRKGSKEFTLGYDETGHKLDNRPTPQERRDQFVLSDDEVLSLARWALQIEKHYSDKHLKRTPMDIEWAKDGLTGDLFIVQARPETVHSQGNELTTKVYSLKERAEPIAQGLAVGAAVAHGPARVVKDPSEMEKVEAGAVLVTEMTDPDWEPVMKRCAAIVTERGSRTSHAAIVSRELGIPAVVGVANATTVIPDGETVTVSTVEGESGRIYRGVLDYDFEEVDLLKLELPKTPILLNVGDPEQSLSLSLLPSQGVGLARMEFILASHVRVHPMALLHPDRLSITVRREVDELTRGYAHKGDYFIDRLAQGIGLITAAFWPRDVILRFSDFKTNEYVGLLGGEAFEPKEENPMLGWRGASRYYHPEYRQGFELELAAVRKVRETFGFGNLKVMVPFCRTPDEGRKVLEVMAAAGLERGKDGLEVYVMAELPSNVLQAREFAEVFDGFSIGSNDLTQLVLGVDRDSERVASIFDERNPAVKRACAMLIKEAHAKGRHVGICGQGPSDYPEFAAFLVEQRIDTISLNPDSLLKTIPRIRECEGELVDAL